VLDLLLALIAAVRVFFGSRTDTSLEVLALRQQVSVLKPETSTTDSEPLRSPVLDHASESVVSMTDALVIVKPETVVGWHRTGFRLYWRWRPGPVDVGRR